MPHSIACRALSAFEPAQNARIPAWLLYPTDAATQPLRFGPYSMDLASDAEVAQRCADLPLVAVSHGNGSSPWTHRGLASRLVQAGFAVLLIEHPGNNRDDNSLGFSGDSGRLKSVLLEYRPRHVRLALDSALADALVGPKLRTTYAAIGHSIGGYTALALAGGRALTLPDDVDPRSWKGPREELLKLAYPVRLEPDPRLRAVVLLAPALFAFAAEAALADVTVPVLLRTGSEDALCSPPYVAHCLRSLPRQEPLRDSEVRGAGHFSFQAPFPAELAHLPAAQDPPGFDRAAYQETLAHDVIAFLRRAF